MAPSSGRTGAAVRRGATGGVLAAAPPGRRAPGQAAAIRRRRRAAERAPDRLTEPEVDEKVRAARRQRERDGNA
jgi:hypothetical protein